MRYTFIYSGCTAQFSLHKKPRATAISSAQRFRVHLQWVPFGARQVRNTHIASALAWGPSSGSLRTTKQGEGQQAFTEVRTAGHKHRGCRRGSFQNTTSRHNIIYNPSPTCAWLHHFALFHGRFASGHNSLRLSRPIRTNNGMGHFTMNLEHLDRQNEF